MADVKTKSPDPAIEAATPETVERDYPIHVYTYNLFLNLLKWFIVHIALLLIGLYFLVMVGSPGVGALFIALAVAALIYGMARNPKVQDDIASASGREEAAE